ncbi:MAG: hypothetical protein LBR17_05970 [Bacteroidales bacterium]|jgi:cytoskeletal protein RodZ|nr:hypothetical protein [Bacteroidales bacterium]
MADNKFNLSKGEEKKDRFNIPKEIKLQALKKSILADGVIDAEEVKQLREVLYSDGKIDKKGADFLFELNNAVSSKSNHESWKTLFVEAISTFLLEDEQSPGEIDTDEAKWLLSKIQGDGRLDKTEKALLDNIKNKAKEIPPVLKPLFSETKKSKWWLWLLLVVVAIVVIIICVKNCSSNGTNKIVTEKTEQVNAKVAEITSELQNPNVNFDEAEAKIVAAQEAIDVANANATTEEEKQAVAEAQAKVEAVAQAVEAAKQAAESVPQTPTEPVSPEAEETISQVASEHPATKPAELTKPATSPSQNSQPATVKPVTSASTTSSATLPKGTIEEKAKRVIRGDYGNGAERKQALGSEYREIQSKVNEIINH